LQEVKIYVVGVSCKEAVFLPT